MRIGIGFLALAGMLSMNGQSDFAFSDPYHGLNTGRGITAYGSPMFNGKPNRKKKVNKLRLSHNAKLKRRT